jgi:DNA-directed RNA polymerase specialized sigma24 family protein
MYYSPAQPPCSPDSEKDRSEDKHSYQPAAFPRTQWSLVRAAAAKGPELSDLCRSYWYPLYGFARRRGASPEQAEDQVQSFLANVCHKDMLARANQERGRFRSFLLTAFTNFTIREHQRTLVQRRGGKVAHIDIEEAERCYSSDCAHDETPERLYLRCWAVEVLDRAVTQLATAYNGSPDRLALFESILPGLEGELPRGSVAGLADRFGVSPVAIRQEAYRLRIRYQKVLRQVVARSLQLATETEIDDELKCLREGLR